MMHSCLSKLQGDIEQAIPMTMALPLVTWHQMFYK